MRFMKILFVLAIFMGFVADYPRMAATLCVVLLLVWWYEIIGEAAENSCELSNSLEVIRVYEHDSHLVADKIRVDVVSAGEVFRDSNAEYYYKLDHFFRDGALAQSSKNKFIHLYNAENPFAQSVLSKSLTV